MLNSFQHLIISIGYKTLKQVQGDKIRFVQQVLNRRFHGDSFLINLNLCFHLFNITSTFPSTRARASCLSRPLAKSLSYCVSAWRMCAITARRIEFSSRLFAVTVRPIRPLYLRHACSAITTSLPCGHNGKSSRTRFAKRSIYFWSNPPSVLLRVLVAVL